MEDMYGNEIEEEEDFARDTITIKHGKDNYSNISSKSNQKSGIPQN